MALLTVRDLRVEFDTRDGVVRALNGVSFQLDKGQVLALLGESGSGKSVTLRSILGLHPASGARVAGEVVLKDLDVNRLGDRVDKLQKHFGQVVEDVRQVAISSDKIAQKAAAIKDVELGPTDGNITQIPEQPALARLN